MFLNPYSLDLLCSAMAGPAPVVPARFPSVYYTSKQYWYWLQVFTEDSSRMIIEKQQILIQPNKISEKCFFKHPVST